ncbi:hypothetical protein FHS27_005431 [Rhodopirellula rubra]|uniref:Uncharacterized protein n=1 Tax=Aporhodopirellula rubra TaxID=980271 RepID=A0A7W5E3M1_9BACT|nr:hypothetical protein [Aporhodopirellula rubra]
MQETSGETAANFRPDRGFASSGIHLLSRAEIASLRLLGLAYAEPITISGIVVIPNHFYVPAKALGPSAGRMGDYLTLSRIRRRGGRLFGSPMVCHLNH